MNNPISLQLFKAEIKKVTLVLQENHEKLPSSWITATKNIISGLDSHFFNINSLLSELEDLAILLLLRSTTRLESICSIEIQSVANEIFQRIKPLKFSRAISSGIEEFLAVSRPPFPEAPLNKEIDQLNQQIRSLQEKLNQSSTRPSLELMTLESPQCSPELLSSQGALDREVKRVSDQGHGSKKEEKKSSGAMEVEKEIKEIGVEKPTPLQEMIDILDSDRKIHSFCILDIEGNFVMADKRAETLFETKHEDLLRSNLFDLMIPYSKFYLEKTLGDSIFSSLDSQPKTFSYTVYSAHALKRYQKEITRMTRKDYAERKRVNEQKFSLDEKKLVTKDNSIYYKYLQTLTSRATLIELKFSKLEDVLKLENTHDVKVKLEHEIFQGPSETQRVVSQPAVLLITRKAYHIQKFRYSLMEEWDDKIIKMEEKVERNLSKNSTKLARKEENFRVKVEMNSYFESDSAMASEDIFQDEDFPSP